MSNTLLSIPEETLASHIPFFAHKTLSPTQLPLKKIKPLNSATFTRTELYTPLADCKTPCSCDCLNVLICDDDPFQAFYYQTMFRMSMDFSDLAVEKRNFRFEVVPSGESLLKRYHKLASCNCNIASQLLIISDFNMGQNNMNGIETVLKLRKDGFDGNIILRTSETKEELRAKYKDFDTLIEKNIINFYIMKDDHNLIKNKIHGLLKVNSD